VAVVIAYDLTREGMDRNTLELPGVQDAVIAAVARRVPTIVLLASDGAVTMPWLSHVQGLLEVWSPSGMVRTDQTLSWYVPAYVRLLDGAVDPSGRLPVTFPVSTQQSPMGVLAFWPGTYGTVDLRAAPDGGLGIGYPWFRAAGWPVLFPFGYGLSYTSFQVTGGTETIGKAGLQLTVSVRDTGGQAGTEPVEVYADWPATLGEPATQLVGFGTVSFTRAEALAGTVKHAVIPIAQDALTTYAGGRWHVARGAYCLEAATYDGDPHAWSTGQVTLAPFGPGIAGPPTVPLTAAACPG
jgi:beta-glucosidase